jgi:hypothetical protein
MPTAKEKTPKMVVVRGLNEQFFTVVIGSRDGSQLIPRRMNMKTREGLEPPISIHSQKGTAMPIKYVVKPQE